MEVEEDQIEDDLEIVASPREARPAGAVASKAGGRRIPMVGYALYAALAAAVSAGFAYMSLGGGEYSAVAAGVVPAGAVAAGVVAIIAGVLGWLLSELLMGWFLESRRRGGE